MIVESTLLSAIPGVRHAFFTREGGISEGIYSGLNGGLGSDDVPDNIRENRRRMADALDVPVANLLSVHQIHSPDVVVASEPWDTSARPKVDAIVTKRPGLALGILVVLAVHLSRVAGDRARQRHRWRPVFTGGAAAVAGGRRTAPA